MSMTGKQRFHLRPQTRECLCPQGHTGYVLGRGTFVPTILMWGCPSQGLLQGPKKAHLFLHCRWAWPRVCPLSTQTLPCSLDEPQGGREWPCLESLGQ